MAIGWSRDGDVQQQIDASVAEAVKLARSRLPEGESLRHCEMCEEPIPEARRNVLLTSMYLASRSDEQVRVDLESIARNLGPCDLGLPDIEIDVPDHRILYVLDLCQELSEKLAPAAGPAVGIKE